jgi:hypothetical protein
VTVPPLPPEVPSPDPNVPPEGTPAGIPPAETAPPALGNQRPGVPWEAWRELGFLTRLFETIRRSLLQPVAFFRDVDPRGPVLAALVYAVVMFWVGMALQLIWEFVLPQPFGSALPPTEGDGLKTYLSPLFLLLFTLLAPIYLPIGLFLYAGLLHLLLLILGGPSRGYVGTLRVLCYSSAPQLFAIVPFCGAFVSLIWSTVLQIIGLREVHGIQTGKSVAVVLIPFLLCFILIAATVVLVLLAVGGVAGLR